MFSPGNGDDHGKMLHVSLSFSLSRLQTNCMESFCSKGLHKFTTTSLLAATLCEEEHLEKKKTIKGLRDMTHFEPVRSFTDYVDFLLQECIRLPDDLLACRQAHASLVNIGLEAQAFVADHLIRAFAIAGSLSEADMVFFKVVKPSLYTWNAIISAHTNFEDWEIAFVMYQQLQQEGLNPDKCTFFAILKACSANLMIQEGRLIHEKIIIHMFASVELLSITLMDMYAKGGYLEDAQSVFQDLPHQNVVSWNVMISGYAQAGEGHRALELFQGLLPKRVAPNSITFACILKVCCELQAKLHGMAVHADIVKLGLESDVVVGSAIVDMHAKFGSLESAHKLFLNLPNPNVVSWNVILKGYAQSIDGIPVFQLFERLRQQGVKPDKVTFLCVIKSCGMAGNLHLGMIIHDEIIKCGFESDISLGNTVIDMYIKVGKVEDGRNVFDNLANRDVVSWNAMLVGYVEHSNAFSALAFFEKMQFEGIKPNEFTYACIVKACCDTGSIDLGKLIHEQILQERIELDVVLGNTLIDMYASCGSPEVAHAVLNDLPAPDALSWNALISGYALCGNTCMVDWCLEGMQAQGLEPNGGTLTSILVACSHGGQVKAGTAYFYSMQKDYGITPNIEHFNCMADLFCRTGCLKEAEGLLQTMPLWPDVSGWTSLLAARMMYGDANLGQLCTIKG